ncbi:hypothetical protein AAZX31_18G274300 [Glycine max]
MRLSNTFNFFPIPPIPMISDASSLSFLLLHVPYFPFCSMVLLKKIEGILIKAQSLGFEHLTRQG